MILKHIDNVLNQWDIERPEVDRGGLGPVLLVEELERAWRRDKARALRELELDTREYDVLAALRRQGKPCRLGASELARETRLSTGAMTNRIDRLEARSLVRRYDNPDDRRGVLVGLTRAGRERIDAAITRRLQAADAALAPLDAAQRHQLESLLRRLTER